MLWPLVIVGVLALVFGPNLWVRWVMRNHGQDIDGMPGTGGELAEHLLQRFEVRGVGVETSEAGDHYDPVAKAVRLTPDKHDGRSLTAITVAAHEVGHAIQDHTSYPPLKWRTRLVKASSGIEKIGAGVLIISPFLGVMTRVPALGVLTFLGGLLALGTAAVIHMVTLPTEFDASFNRALPMLHKHKILKSVDRPHAHKLLTAAALTYVSASLMSLLNIARWIAILRR